MNYFSGVCLSEPKHSSFASQYRHRDIGVMSVRILEQVPGTGRVLSHLLCMQLFEENVSFLRFGQAFPAIMVPWLASVSTCE
jgi:hypothetical protein